MAKGLDFGSLNSWQSIYIYIYTNHRLDSQLPEHAGSFFPNTPRFCINRESILLPWHQQSGHVIHIIPGEPPPFSFPVTNSTHLDHEDLEYSRDKRSFLDSPWSGTTKSVWLARPGYGPNILETKMALCDVEKTQHAATHGMIL